MVRSTEALDFFLLSPKFLKYWSKCCFFHNETVRNHTKSIFLLKYQSCVFDNLVYSIRRLVFRKRLEDLGGNKKKTKKKTRTYTQVRTYIYVPEKVDIVSIDLLFEK